MLEHVIKTPSEVPKKTSDTSTGEYFKAGVKGIARDKLGRVVLGPLNDLVDENISDVATTIGSFVIRSIRGRFTRSITFTIGHTYADRWMEEALYGILYRWNKIKTKTNLELGNSNNHQDGSGMYYRLGNGTHSLKYRDYNILLVIRTLTPSSTTGRMYLQREYTIITYDLSPDFIGNFERDMIINRNALLQIRSDAPTVNVYRDMHESDGYTYWEKSASINKRRIDTVYLPREQKALLVNTINSFLSKDTVEFYKRQGVAHNLKILLYGPPGTGKDTIAKMIASEWNRNIYYVTGGKGGKFVPDAITSDDSDINYPLFLISDIDKYPFLISDTNVTLDDAEKSKEDQMLYKQTFGKMINALDGVMSAEHRIIVMTTNHHDKFSPVLTRPGRVDLELHIGYVTTDVFRKYAYDNYAKILPKKIQLKSDTLTVADMQFDLMFLKLTGDEFVKKYLK